MRTLLNKAAAAVSVVGSNLLLDLADGEAVCDELIGVELDLIFLCWPTKTGYIDDTGNAFESFLQSPVFEGFLLHYVVGGVGALNGIPVDLADGTPIGAHLRHKAIGQINLVQAFEHMLAIHIARRAVIEDEHEAGQASQRGGAQVREVRNAGHLNFNGHRHLTLNLLSAAAGPLRDDLHVVVGDVRISLNRQVAERDDAPRGEHDNTAENKPAVSEREINKGADHLLIPRCFKQ